jgi:hypothetical protein
MVLLDISSEFIVIITIITVTTTTTIPTPTAIPNPTTIPTPTTVTTAFVVVLVTSKSLGLFLLEGLKLFQVFVRPSLYFRHVSFYSTVASVFCFPLLI